MCDTAAPIARGKPLDSTPPRERDLDAVCQFMSGRSGYQYDLHNVVDLMRYVIQRPPVPLHGKRRMLTLGSGDNTRAICSSLIAQAFQSVRYPILPGVEWAPDAGEIHPIRHHTRYAPRDFDVSPNLDVIKPRLRAGFDSHEPVWNDQTDDAAAPSSAR